jgi:hypothetical protein
MPTLYAFNIGGWGKRITYNGRTACQSFGAVHDYATKPSGEFVYYGVMPDCTDKLKYYTASQVN